MTVRVLVSLLVLSGCGGTYVARLQSGTYALVAASDESRPVSDFGGLELTLDVTNKSAELRSDAGVQLLTLTTMPDSMWIPDCFTKNSHVANETLQISTNPLNAGPYAVPGPVLTRDCGGMVMIGTLGKTKNGYPDLLEPILIFH